MFLDSKAVTDMKLEGGSSAHMMLLSMQLHFLRLCVLRLQGAAAKEVHSMRKSQLSTLCVGFKVHYEGFKEERV